jgi:threonine dehydrogenase-like Zn-dependent dehydrogenase
MKALRFENDELKLAEIALPKASGECLVRVLQSGICNTDLEIVRGYAGFSGTIGHEFVGVVETSNSPELIGKRIVGEINVGCGRCELCKGDDARHCPNRTVLGIHGRDGAHAEFLTLPAENLLIIDDSISNAQAVFIEPLAAAFGITEQVEIAPETHVAVIGDGKLGILCAWSLALKSNNLFLVGKHPDKLKIAAKSSGIQTVLPENIKKLNRAFDVVVEASGSESGFATALDLLKPRGKLVLKSTFQGTPVWQAARVVVDEITIVGSRCGRFAPALELLKEKKIDVESLISEEFALSNALKAMDCATQKGVLKVLLKP